MTEQRADGPIGPAASFAPGTDGYDISAPEPALQAMLQLVTAILDDDHQARADILTHADLRPLAETLAVTLTGVLSLEVRGHSPHVMHGTPALRAAVLAILGAGITPGDLEDLDEL